MTWSSDLVVGPAKIGETGLVPPLYPSDWKLGINCRVQQMKWLTGHMGSNCMNCLRKSMSHCG